ncbi:hypothetical protein Lfu02_35400 [Longispora fulva]|uniref:Uncharacterized protein n=1 Tax=Longispora fulva TaxID=619741 RepID=A0A8J7KZU0_9ACTN|nr:hypothetical protein [Longispora fulva]MBG6141677.1 hypothetical protein [Longispora fulva]GIG59168.1 hypothetical protein Lfu02_35400 [Longispora fulva]
MAELAEITSEHDARQVMDTHHEDDEGHCAACILAGVTIHAPCYARIEAHRFLDRLGLMP